MAHVYTVPIYELVKWYSLFPKPIVLVKDQVHSFLQPEHRSTQRMSQSPLLLLCSFGTAALIFFGSTRPVGHRLDNLSSV